jgi:hypothetical protein
LKVHKLECPPLYNEIPNGVSEPNLEGRKICYAKGLKYGILTKDSNGKDLLPNSCSYYRLTNLLESKGVSITKDDWLGTTDHKYTVDCMGPIKPGTIPED